MEYNSENNSDASGIHLEGNFLFSLSLLLETEFLTDTELLFSISD